MIKTYSQINKETGFIEKATWANGQKSFRCITGIQALPGGALFEGDDDQQPFTLDDLKNEGSDEAYRAALNFVSNPDTPWEPLEEKDVKFVSKWLKIWKMTPKNVQPVTPIGWWLYNRPTYKIDGKLYCAGNFDGHIFNDCYRMIDKEHKDPEHPERITLIPTFVYEAEGVNLFTVDENSDEWNRLHEIADFSVVEKILPITPVGQWWNTGCIGCDDGSIYKIDGELYCAANFGNGEEYAAFKVLDEIHKDREDNRKYYLRPKYIWQIEDIDIDLDTIEAEDSDEYYRLVGIAEFHVSYD